MNKFDLINKVLISGLNAEDKCLLIELITRSDDDWVCWPSVERLCQVRGIKHEKNFKGADVYLPGLVTKSKRGRKNVYQLDVAAIALLDQGYCVIKHTPAREGVLIDTPAVEGVNSPAVAENTPAVEGANTTIDTTKDNTHTASKVGGSNSSSSKLEVREAGIESSSNSDWDTARPASSNGITTTTDTPATEGVLKHENQCIEPGCMMLKYKTRGLDICHKHYMKQKYPDTKPYVEKVTPKTDLELAVW